MECAHPGGKPQAGVIVPVQFLRGAAASFVVSAHLLDRLVKRHAFPHALPDWVWSLGDMGVATFFAISGFIMVHTTAHEFALPGAGPRFFYRRLIRIAPVYYLTSAAMVLFMAVTLSVSTNAAYHRPAWPDIIMSLLFIPYINAEGVAQPVYVLGWTLEYEMLFYAIFALALALPRRIGLTGIILFLLAAMTVGTRVPVPPPTAGLPVPVYYFTRLLLSYFVLGMGLAMIRMRWGAMASSVPEWALCAIALAALGVGVRLGPKGVEVASMVTVTLALAVTTLLQGRHRWTTRWSVLAQSFGDASYSIYLTHSFLLGGIAVVAARLAGQRPVILVCVVLASCGLCWAAGWLTWHFVEMPIMRLLRGKAKRPKPAS